MILRTSTFAVAAATLLLCTFTPAHAASDDKYVSATECLPYAPDTTAAELQITPTGAYNPGTTVEKIICPLPRDQDTPYVVQDLNLAVYYRNLGGTSSRMTCSLYVGSTTVQTNPVFTTTASGGYSSAGSRAFVSLSGGPQTQYAAMPGNVVCTLPPKTSMGGIYMQEFGPTTTP